MPMDCRIWRENGHTSDGGRKEKVSSHTHLSKIFPSSKIACTASLESAIYRTGSMEMVSGNNVVYSHGSMERVIGSNGVHSHDSMERVIGNNGAYSLHSMAMVTGNNGGYYN
jgi:hypothetical protein